MFTHYFSVFFTCLCSSFSTSPALCIAWRKGWLVTCYCHSSNRARCLGGEYLPEFLWDTWRGVICCNGYSGGVSWDSLVSGLLQCWACMEPGRSSRFPIRMGASWYLPDLSQETVLKCFALDSRRFRKIMARVFLCHLPESLLTSNAWRILTATQALHAPLSIFKLRQKT